MKFRREWIESVVAKELADCQHFENWHGITPQNLEKHLVLPPRSERFSISGSRALIGLWIIIDELPADTQNGYLITFDPREYKDNVECGGFGLASKRGRRRHGLYVGHYGSLSQTLGSM